MLVNPGKLVIVQTSTPQLRMIEPKPKRLDQVECGPRVRAQTDDIARIRRDLRLVEDDCGQRHDRARVASRAHAAAATSGAERCFATCDHLARGLT